MCVCNKSSIVSKKQLTSGVAATLFSNGNVSFGTPTVNFEYGVPFGLSSVPFEKERATSDDGVARR
jgi:hypothetical protein